MSSSSSSVSHWGTCGVALVFLILILIAVIMAWSRCSACARPPAVENVEEGNAGIQLIEQFQKPVVDPANNNAVKPFGQPSNHFPCPRRHTYLK